MQVVISYSYQVFTNYLFNGLHWTPLSCLLLVNVTLDVRKTDLWTVNLPDTNCLYSDKELLLCWVVSKNMEVFHTIWWCFCLLTCAYCIPQTLLYEYANSESSQLPKGDEISSPKIQLQKPIVFYGIPYDSIYVSTFANLNCHLFNVKKYVICLNCR